MCMVRGCACREATTLTPGSKGGADAVAAAAAALAATYQVSWQCQLTRAMHNIATVARSICRGLMKVLS